MAKVFNENIDILGASDSKQLVVRSNTTQAEPLQEWQQSDGTAIAQLTEDGNLRVGGDLSLTTPEAIIEANRTVDPHNSAETNQGIQSRGVLDGSTTQISEPNQWSVQELALNGSGGLDSIQSTIKAEVTNNNSGSSPNASLRAGDFQVTQNAGMVGEASAITASLDNASGATLTDGMGVHVQSPSNAGTLQNAYGVKVEDIAAGTNNYAIHTGQGRIALGDVLEVEEQVSTPATPNTGTLLIYPKDDGKLYIKNSTGVEYDLTQGTNSAQGDVTLALLESLVVNSVGGFIRTADGDFIQEAKSITLSFTNGLGTNVYLADGQSGRPQGVIKYYQDTSDPAFSITGTWNGASGQWSSSGGRTDAGSMSDSITNLYIGGGNTEEVSVIYDFGQEVTVVETSAWYNKQGVGCCTNFSTCYFSDDLLTVNEVLRGTDETEGWIKRGDTTEISGVRYIRFSIWGNPVVTRNMDDILIRYTV